MNNYIAIAITLVLAVVIGTTFLTGDTNSLQAALGDIMTDVNDAVSNID